MKKSNGDLLTPPKRREVIQAIIDFYASERNEQIGIIAAETLLDVILLHVSPILYNQALVDVKNVLHEHYAASLIDIEVLQKETF